MKTSKIFVIKTCFICPNRNGPLVLGYHPQRCSKKKNKDGSYRKITGIYNIPKWCPLEDYKENNEKRSSNKK